LSTNCYPDDDRSICHPGQWDSLAWLPLYGALLGLLVATVGCWVRPRKHRDAWLAIGNFSALGALCAASVGA
jgi:hypothetical protein